MMTQIKAMAILAFTALAAAQLDKPPLQEGSDDLAPANSDACPEHTYQVAAYDAGMIPEDCANIAMSEGLNPADFENFYVTFDDCDQPWTFCRHNQHPVSIDDMAKKFSKVPVGMRDYVKSVIGILGGGGAYNSDGNIAFKGDFGLNGPFNGWLHESAHSLDGQGALNGHPAGSWYSDSDDWAAAYNADTNVPDVYSQNNQQENIAQVTVLAIYDQIVEGGIAAVRPNWQGIQNQLQKVKDLNGARILPGGTCQRSAQSSGPVPAAAASSRIASFKPFKLTTKHD